MFKIISMWSYLELLMFLFKWSSSLCKVNILMTIDWPNVPIYINNITHLGHLKAFYSKSFHVDKRIHQCKDTAFVLFWVKGFINVLYFASVALWWDVAAACGLCVGWGEGKYWGENYTNRNKSELMRRRRGRALQTSGDRGLFLSRYLWTHMSLIIAGDSGRKRL